MVLEVIHDNPKLRVIADYYGVNKSLVSRELHHILPKLYCHLAQKKLITWPDHPAAGFANSNGIVDCTSHFRRRVHPRSGDWYRGDKHRYFISAEVVCGHNGVMWQVIIDSKHCLLR